MENVTTNEEEDTTTNRTFVVEADELKALVANMVAPDQFSLEVYKTIILHKY